MMRASGGGCVTKWSRPHPQCCAKYPLCGQVLPVRWRKQVADVSCGAEPGLSPLRGRDNRNVSGGMNTGIQAFVINLDGQKSNGVEYTIHCNRG